MADTPPSTTAPPADLTAALSGDTLPDEAVLLRAEEKPPMYRFFRLAMYISYMVVVVWLVVSIIVGAWNSVWGPQGHAVQAKQAATAPH